MKAKVLTRFIDKETKELHEVGSIIDVSETRSKEILAAGNYIEVVKTAKVKKEATK